MERAQRARRSDRVATETALMAAALRLLERDGVLAGLNLQEVADEAGVNRALIHRYFGSRRALLQAALDTRKQAMAPGAATLARLDPEKRSIAAFPHFARDPSYPQVVMLLALDGDEQFEPLPYLEERLAMLEKEQQENVWLEDADLLAVMTVLEVFVYGYFVMRSSIARQLGMSVKTLDRRVTAALGRMSEAFLAKEPSTT
ncbi:MAG TPA: helix-turn-helix domain-containing protein [Acidimicrobiales bacterium]|nr:helix-turn-helix domain-containing protein [Acidimicrobiales bacterium]